MTREAETSTQKAGKAPRVTVLVPIYNVEKYLLQCLESLHNQILDDMEILCLDDGSTDSSADILKDFAKRDSRIKIITKKNTGYGDTLNQGIKLAKGEYIGIVEPDDFVDPAMFIELYALAKKHDADVVRCNYFEYRNGEDLLHENFTEADANKIINPLEDSRVFYYGPSIWAAIYKKAFLIKEKIFFLDTPGAAYQDTSFNFKTLAAGGKIVFSEKAYLHYRRDNETSSVKSSDKVFAINKEFAEIEDFLKKRKLVDSYGYIFQAIKFAGYHWNMLRLSDKDLEKFLLRMRAEFHDAENKGLIKRKYFPKNHWRALRVILDVSPKAFTLVFKAYRKKKKAGM